MTVQELKTIAVEQIFTVLPENSYDIYDITLNNNTANFYWTYKVLTNVMDISVIHFDVTNFDINALRNEVLDDYDYKMAFFGKSSVSQNTVYVTAQELIDKIVSNLLVIMKIDKDLIEVNTKVIDNGIYMNIVFKYDKPLYVGKSYYNYHISRKYFERYCYDEASTIAYHVKTKLENNKEN